MIARRRREAIRIKADTETTNAIAVGTLLIKAKIGELMPAKTRKETGRGKKTPSPGEAVFSSSTTANYRKLDKHEPRISEYRDKVEIKLVKPLYLLYQSQRCQEGEENRVCT